MDPVLTLTLPARKLTTKEQHALDKLLDGIKKVFDDAPTYEQPTLQGVLRFDLSDPYIHQDMLRHLNLGAMCSAIFEFEQDVIRRMNKYDTLDGIELKKYTKKTLVENITRKFHECFEGIDYA